LNKSALVEPVLGEGLKAFNMTTSFYRFIRKVNVNQSLESYRLLIRVLYVI